MPCGCQVAGMLLSISASTNASKISTTGIKTLSTRAHLRKAGTKWRLCCVKSLYVFWYLHGHCTVTPYPHTGLVAAFAFIQTFFFFSGEEIVYFKKTKPKVMTWPIEKSLVYWRLNKWAGETLMWSKNENTFCFQNNSNWSPCFPNTNKVLLKEGVKPSGKHFLSFNI